MRRILKKIGHSHIEGMCDNTSTIKLSKNPALHGCFKHIREILQKGAINLLFCGTRNPTC